MSLSHAPGAGPGWSASAPGKVVLLGEYAVLEGAPAVSLAINRRARVRIAATSGTSSEVLAPEVGCPAVPFRITAEGEVDWTMAKPGEAQALVLVDQTLRGLKAMAIRLPEAPGFRLELDTSEFFAASAGGQLKLGLGSSAALTAALAAAIASYAASEERVPSLSLLLRLHRDFQAGRGSGVDVATSFAGGLLRYQLQPEGSAPRAEPAPWPAGLQALFVWSGRSASTPRFLARLAGWRAGHESDYTRRLQDLAAIARDAAAAILGGDPRSFVRCAAAYSSGLHALGVASGVDIVSAEHLAIGRIADAGGVVYKSCGAGGGDIGVALALDPERLSRLQLRLLEAGFACVDLAPDPVGLVVAAEGFPA